MREVERTEAGVLFVAGDGKLTFHNRSRRYNTTPALTLNAGQYHLAEPVELPGDDFGVVNDYTVSRPNAAAARAVNQSSIDELGLYRDSKDIVAETDDEALAAAQWRVNTTGEPHTRVPN